MVIRPRNRLFVLFAVSLGLGISLVDAARGEVKKQTSVGETHVQEQTVQVTPDGVAEAVTENHQGSGLVNETSVVDGQDLSEELYFGLDLGVPQTLYDDFEEQQVARIIQARNYMQQQAAEGGGCTNKAEDCSYYAVVGECERNPAFMSQSCAPMCQMCSVLPNQGAFAQVPTPPEDPNCPVDYSTNAWGAGDLNKMFERIVQDPAYQIYEPKVLSRPTLAPGDTVETADYIVGGPWMVVFDNFVKEEEADRLVELGALEGYERSMDVQNFNQDGSVAPGVSPSRTSTNAWCMDACAADPMAIAVANRIAEVTHIPEPYQENLQLLRYETGQFCK